MMNEISYRQLTRDDLSIFVDMRLKQLQEEGAKPILDLTPALEEYYEKHLKSGTFISWLAIEGDKIIGTCGISFVEKPPYYSNPSGKIGLLSSMYILVKYRRKGIAKQLLSRVVREAKCYGCSVVQIDASEQGVLLYKNFGFINNGKHMQYTVE